jgi:hypoxanthine-guanine phosphoribosyltransferase
MKKKSYKITFDLKEGYSDSGKEHPLKFAEKVIQHWMEERLQQDDPIITGLLQGGSLFYPSVGKDVKRSVTIAHSAIFSGELSSPHDALRKGREVKNTLRSLALAIKRELKQESVFIIYRDENWCI